MTRMTGWQLGMCGVTVMVASACGAHSLTAGLGGATAPASSASSPRSADAANRPRSAGIIAQTYDPDAPENAGADQEHDAESAGQAKPWVYLPDGRVDKYKEAGKLYTELTGFTPAEATQRARAAGYKFEVEVIVMQDRLAGCKDGTVCAYEPYRWEWGVSRTLTLKVNRKPDVEDAP